MNKKYLILKKYVPKKQYGGWLGNTSSASALQKYAFRKSPEGLEGINPALVDATMPPPQTALEKAVGPNYGMGDASSFLEQGKDGMSQGTKAGLISTGANLVAAGSNALFSNAMDKNSRTDGFGNEVFDEKDQKLATGQSTASGALKGAGQGASIGSIVPGIGTAAGAVIGGLIGGVSGLIKGKKKAKEDKDVYALGLDKNIMSAGRSADIRSSQMLTGKNGTKLVDKKDLGSFKIPKKKSTSLVLRKGGKLEEPGAVNVVVKGKLHKENNNLGNKDKGIPVVDSNGTKEYEVEKGEIIFRQETTHLIEEKAKEFKESNDDAVLEDLGKTLAKELLSNTQDNDGTFGVKVKDNAN